MSELRTESSSSKKEREKHEKERELIYIHEKKLQNTRKKNTSEQEDEWVEEREKKRKLQMRKIKSKTRFFGCHVDSAFRVYQFFSSAFFLSVGNVVLHVHNRKIQIISFWSSLVESISQMSNWKKTQKMLCLFNFEKFETLCSCKEERGKKGQH